MPPTQDGTATPSAGDPSGAIPLWREIRRSINDQSGQGPPMRIPGEKRSPFPDDCGSRAGVFAEAVRDGAPAV